MSKPNIGNKFSHNAVEGGRSHVLCIHMPHKVILGHATPTMAAHEPSLLEGRSDPKQLNQSGERVSDVGKISDAPTQRRRLTTHEGIESLSFREDFDEIMNF